MSAILAEQRARFWGTLANRTVVVNRGRQKQKLKRSCASDGRLASVEPDINLAEKEKNARSEFGHRLCRYARPGRADLPSLRAVSYLMARPVGRSAASAGSRLESLRTHSVTWVRATLIRGV
jgi:hypothetical protein